MSRHTLKDSTITLPRMFSNADLRRLILPLIVEHMLAVSIGLFDTIMISSVGEAAVSAVSLVDSVNILFVQFFAAIATGGAVVVAQYMGKKEYSQAGEAARQLVWSGTLLSIVLMAILLIADRNLLELIFGEVELSVMDNSEIYFIITLLSYPFFALFNSGSAIFRSMGNSRISMNISLVMNFINIFGNALTIYVFGWGVAGAAIATVLARVTGAAIMVIAMTKRHHIIPIGNLLKIKLNWMMIKRILRIGIPSGVEGTVFQVGKIIVQSFIASLGTAAIAANAILNTITSLMAVPGGAIGLGTLTVVGQCVGAKDYSQVYYYVKRLITIVYIIMACIGIILFISVVPMVTMFNLSSEATTLAIDIARVLYIVNAVIWPLAFTLPQALRAAGDVKFTMITSISTMWLIRIGGSYLFSHIIGLGLHGVWLAMYLDWVVRALCFVVRYRNAKWQKHQVI